MRIAWVLLACAVAGHAGIDGRLVGAWTTKVGEVSFTWDICESGAYMLQAEGAMPYPGEYGTLEAADGRWQLKATNLRADQGTYSLDGAGKLTAVSPKGTLSWERIAEAPRFTPPPKLPGQLARVAVRDLLEAAMGHARIWQGDAVFVGARGTATAEGFFDLTAGPPLNLVFHSPSTNQGLVLTPVKTGDVFWGMGPKPMLDLTVPLADGFLDLPDAMKRAAAAGCAVAPANPVQLRGWSGEPERTAWQIGGNPMVRQNFFLDAVTGERVAFEALAGNEAAAKKLDEWQKGKPLALGEDFGEWRREADLWAKRWNETAAPYEVWVTGAYQGGLKVRVAVFLYFAEGKGAVETACVAVTAKALQGKRGERVKGRPTPLPEGLILPADAAKVLWGLNPQIPPEHTYLQLLFVPEGEEAPRGWPSSFGYRRSNLGGIMAQRGPVPKGERWIWRMIARRPGAETGVGMGGNYQSHVGAVHCDAKTGEALDVPAPTFGPTKFR
jgi:hypothetical protein